MTCSHRTKIVIDGRHEGEITISEDEQRCVLKRSGFISELTVYICKSKVGHIARLLTKQNWAALHDFDLELLPWYCPKCDILYPARSWHTWDVFDDDGWHDQVRGRCPQGHERMLED